MNDNEQIAQFNASSFEWPSSTRMELMAVVSLISILPVQSNINIFIDSNNIIEKYKKLKNQTSYRKKKKVINYNLWEIFFWIEKKLSINIVFNKVKAHSGNKLNDKADILAKLGTEKPSFRINDVLIEQKANLAWLEFSIDKNPREFIKEVNNIRIDNKLEHLNRLTDLSTDHNDITYEFINYKDEKSDTGFFSIKRRQHKIF